MPAKHYTNVDDLPIMTQRVYKLMAQGQTNNEIAAYLRTTPKNVVTCLHFIYEALGIANTSKIQRCKAVYLYWSNIQSHRIPLTLIPRPTSCYCDQCKFKNQAECKLNK